MLGGLQRCSYSCSRRCSSSVKRPSPGCVSGPTASRPPGPRVVSPAPPGRRHRGGTSVHSQPSLFSAAADVRQWACCVAGLGGARGPSEQCTTPAPWDTQQGRCSEPKETKYPPLWSSRQVRAMGERAAGELSRAPRGAGAQRASVSPREPCSGEALDLLLPGASCTDPFLWSV